MVVVTALVRYLLAILAIAGGVAFIAVVLRAVVSPLERRLPEERDPLAPASRAVVLNASLMLLLVGALAAAIGARAPGVGLVVFGMLALPHAVVVCRSWRRTDPFAVGIAKGMAVVTLVLVVGAVVMPECTYGGCVPIVLVVARVWSPTVALLLVALAAVLIATQVRVLRSVARIREDFPEASPSRMYYNDGVSTAGVCIIGVPLVALIVRTCAGVVTGVMAGVTQGPAAPQQTTQRHAPPEAPRIDVASLPVAATLWSVELDAPRDGVSAVPRTPAIAPDGTIYVATRDGLAAVNPDGSLRWRRPDVRSTGTAPAVADDGTIYLTSAVDTTFNSAHELAALAPDGAIRWRYPGTGPYPPAIGHDGTIYVADPRGALLALRPSGTLRWRRTLERDSISYANCPPVVDADGTVYLTVNEGRKGGVALYAVRPDGTIRWRRGGYGGHVVLGPEGMLYVTRDSASDQTVRALRRDGSESWPDPPRGFSRDIAVAADGLVYLPRGDDSRPELVGLHADGGERWRLSLVIGESDRWASELTLGADGTILVPAAHRLLAVASDGRPAWQSRPYPQRGYSSAPAVGADGTIYAATIGDGLRVQLHALRPPAPPFTLMPTGWPAPRGDARNTGRVRMRR